MIAAALAPQAVLSLTLCEPPAFQLLPESPEAKQIARAAEAHLRQAGDDADWLRGFAAIFGRSTAIPDQLPPPLAQGVRAVRAVRRRPWEGELPVSRLAEASFPKLVISGDHSNVFEAICDSLAARLRAERRHVAGAGHATPDTGEPFNRTIARFIGAASIAPSASAKQ
jgi:hypothetical protein